MDKATPTPSPATPIQVTVLKPAIWMESGIAGDWHIMVQYADDAPFEYAALFYRYGYTDNATIHRAATEIAISIGASEPVEERQRPLRAEVERLAAQAAPVTSLVEKHMTEAKELAQARGSDWWRGYAAGAHWLGKEIIELKEKSNG